MQVQQQRERKQPSPRWQLSIGEWMILLLNVLLAGFSGWFILYLVDYWKVILPEDGGAKPGDYLGAITFIVLAGTTSLTCLLLCLRQPRTAAWLQWLAAIGMLLSFLGDLWLFRTVTGWSLVEFAIQLGVALLLGVLFVLSGRFLGTVEVEK